MRQGPGQPAGLPEIARLLSVAGRYDDAQGVLDLARRRAGDLPELTRAGGDLLWRRGQRDAAAAAWESARAAGGDRLEARLAVSAARSDRAAAAGLLREALLRSYSDTAADLSGLALAEADIAALGEALVACAADPDTALGAVIISGVLDALPGQAELPAAGFEVRLSPSWFAGLTDPNDHPLLTRYLPELRLRQPWRLPRISLQLDPGLEPGGYQIVVLGLPTGSNTVPLDADYVDPEAAPLLSAAAQARVTGLWTELLMLRSTGEPATGLDSLLLIAPAEILTIRLEQIATGYRKTIEQFQRHPAVAGEGG